MGGLLRVAETSQDNWDSDDLTTFAIEPTLKAATEDEFDVIFNRLSQLNVESSLDFYNTFWPRLAGPFPPTPSSPTALTHLIILYEELENRIEEIDPDQIIVEDDIQRNYRAVLSDVANEYDIEFEEPIELDPFRGYFIAIYNILLRLIDQVFSLIWKHTYDFPRSSSTIFVPNINRFGSMKPVLEAADFEYSVVIPRPTIDWLRVKSEPGYREVVPFDPIPIDCFVTLPTLIRELKFAFFKFPIEIVVRKSVEQRLIKRLEEAFGVRLACTVAYSLTQIHENAMALLYREITNEIIDITNAKQMVFGSRGSIQMAMIDTARARNIETYHVPHTVTIGYEVVPEKTTHFLASPVEYDHLENSEQVTDLTNIVPAGRPYLRELPEQKPQPSLEEDEILRVVIATQPYEDDVRREFVTDVIAGLSDNVTDVEIVVKIHPNEDPKFYSSFIENSTVTISESDLFQHIVDADMVVTINSNVGIESMVLGTPCVCVNEWSPLIRTRAYAKGGPIPVLESSEEVKRWFGTVSKKDLQTIAEQQSEYVNEAYLLEEDTASCIVKKIKEDRNELIQ